MMVATIELPAFKTLPAAYGRAYTNATADWTPERRALGRDILLWLFNTQPAHSQGPLRPGREFDLRLVTDREYDAMRRDVMAARPANAELQDQLLATADAVKQFHIRAHAHLSPTARARLVLLADIPAVR